MRKTLAIAAMFAVAGITTASANAGFAVFRTNLSPGSNTSYSFTDSDGIGITATADSTNASNFTPLVTRNASGLGVNSGANPNGGPNAYDNSPNQLNHSYFAETLWLTFDTDVFLNRLVLKNVGFMNYAGKYVGAEGYKLIDANGIQLASGFVSPDANSGFTSIYFSNLPGSNKFGIQAMNGPGRYDYASFNVDAVSVKAVPLPTAAWSGLGMLGLLGAGALRKKGLALLRA